MKPTALLLIVVAASACDKSKTESVTASSATPVASASVSATAKAKPALPAPPAEALALKTDKDTALTHAIAFPTDDGLKIVAANEAIHCGDFESRAAPPASRVSLQMDVPYGPDAKLFAGHRIGVPGQIEGAGIAGSYINANQLVVQIDSGEAKVGAHVKGWAIWTRGTTSARGTFDATVCPAAFPVHPNALTADATGNVTGDIAGEKFESKKALVLVREKENEGTYVSEMDFFATTDVNCDSVPAKDTTTPSLALTNVGGATTKSDLSGTVQPVSAMYAPTGWKIGKSRVTGGGWIQFDALDFDAPLKGTVRVATPKGTIGGAFTAEVCRKPK